MRRPSRQYAEQIRDRLVAHFETRVRVLRATWLQLAQTAFAAGLAWFVAHDLLGHKNAFFAPIAAVIALGVVPGNHVKRAAQVVVGVGVGIAIGDALIAGIGRGAWQVALVVLLAMSAALLLGGGALVVSQSASSAVLVVAVTTSSGGRLPTRFVDAIVGGLVGLAVLAAVPRDLAKTLKRAASPAFVGLADVLEEVAAALENRDVAAANRALEHARGLDEHVSAFMNTVNLASDTVLIAPHQRHQGDRVMRYAQAVTHVGYAIRNARVLARGAVRAVELEPTISPRLIESIRELAVVVRRLEAALDTGSDGRAVRTAVESAAAEATASLEDGMGFAVGVLVGQVRSISLDLLRALGLERKAAVDLIRASGSVREFVRE